MCVDFRFYVKTVIGSLLQGRGLFFYLCQCCILPFGKGVSYLWQRCLLPSAKVSLTFGKGFSYFWQRCLLPIAKVSLTFGKGVSYLWQKRILPLAKVSLTFSKGVSYLWQRCLLSPQFDAFRTLWTPRPHRPCHRRLSPSLCHPPPPNQPETRCSRWKDLAKIIE